MSDSRIAFVRIDHTRLIRPEHRERIYWTNVSIDTKVSVEWATSGSENGTVTVDWSVPNGAALGTYTLTFTASSGTITHSVKVTLTVK